MRILSNEKKQVDGRAKILGPSGKLMARSGLRAASFASCDGGYRFHNNEVK